MPKPLPVASPTVLSDFQPATFLERGATVPFTSPLLQQGRLRLAAGKHREIVIRNPSGAPGWYVGPFEAAVEMARVTVHDRLVYRRIEATGAVTPLEVREAVRAVAADGYAGQDAKAAAIAAIEAEETAWRDTYARLLAALLRQSRRSGGEAIAAAHSRAELMAATPALVAPVAPQFGLSPGGLAGALEEVASLLARLGAPGDPPRQVERDLAAARTLLEGIEALLAEDANADPDAGRTILAHGQATVALASAALAQARQEAASPASLLRAWAQDRDATRARLTRAEWLLDGWPYLLSLWSTAVEQTNGRPRRVLADLLQSLPPLPREVTGAAIASFAPAGAPGPPLRRRAAWINDLTEAELVARNERALARSVS